MSTIVKHWQHESAKQAMDWLFENHTSWMNPGYIHVWTESFATLGGGNLAGGFNWVSREMLKGRVYSVNYHNDSVGICFYDQVFIDRMPNRSYPCETRCVKARLPFI